MKIRLYSDIHNEFYTQKRRDARSQDVIQFGWEIPKLEDEMDTVLVLAGDIWDVYKSMQYANRLAPRFKAVILIHGNHEYYKHDITLSSDRAEYLLDDRESNLYILDDDYIVLDNTLFIGSTLWTDVNGSDYIARLGVGEKMNDYKHIWNSSTNHKLRVDDTILANLAAREFLKKTFCEFAGNEDIKNRVLITHHAPDIALQDRNTDDMSYAFWNTGVDFFHEHTDYWLFGHVHEAWQRDYHGTYYATNCRGYDISDDYREVVPGFDPEGLKIVLP